MFRQKLKNFLKKLISFEFYEDLLVNFLKFFIKRNPVALINKNFNQKHPYLSASTSIVLISLLLFSSLWWVFFRNTQPVAAWWDDTWRYRKAIAVTNSSGGALTDFQVKILDNKDLSADITAGKIQSDLDDLRFTDINGNLLPYWIEDSTGSSVDVWVKMASIPTTGAMVYMYYGNASAVSKQDGEKVFEFFDDFSSGNLNNWTNPCSATVTSGYMNIDSSSSCDIAPVYAKNLNLSDAVGYILEFKGKFLSGGGGRLQLYQRVRASNGYIARFWTNGTSSTLYQEYTGSWSTALSVGANNMSADTWYVLKARVNGSNNTFYVNGTSIGSSASSASLTPFSDLTIGLGAISTTVQYDDVRVRKYASTDPSAGTPATEEKSSGPVGYWSFDEGYGTTANDGSGQGNDGTLGNYSKTNPSWQNESSCVSGKCLNFNGDANNGSYVNTGIVEGLAEATDITISAWINQKQLHGDYQSVSSDQWTKYWFGLNLNSQDLSFCIKKTDNNMVCSGTHTMPTSNDWHYVVGVASETSGYVRLYVDGVQVKNVDSSFAIKKTAGNVFIGSVSNGVAGDYFNGYIDEPKIYPYARTADQIKQDYNAGVSGMGASTGSAFGGKSDKWMSDGLVGHWKMDEASWGTVSDSSGNGNNGTANNGATVGVGKFGNGGSFDGVDDYVDVGNSSSIKNFTDKITVSAWAKYSAYGGGGQSYSVIAVKGTPWTFLMENPSNKIRFRVTAGGLDKNAADSVAHELNRWYHFVGTYDGQNIKIYKDGILVGTTPATGNLGTNDVTAKIGTYTGSSYNFNGSIDDVRIYNRALTPSEVEGLYNFAPGPVGHWKMDEGSGTTANDISGNGNHGTLTNMDGSSDWVSGKYGKALDFDGTDDYVAGSSNLGISGNAQFTMCAWIKWAGSSWSSNFPSFMGNNSTGTTNQGLSFTVRDGRPAIDFWINRWRATSALSVNTWYYVCGTKNQGLISTSSKIYINGELVTGAVEGTDTTPNITNSIPIIGRLDATRWFNGQIDDVRIYNYARTQKQILEDMNAGSPAQKQAVAHWKFDEGYGTTTKDSAGSNDGTISGATWTNEGRLGKALSFDGADDYASGNFGLGILKNGYEEDSFTLSAWAKPDGTQSGNERIISGRSGYHGGLVANSNNSFGFNIATTEGWTNGKMLSSGEISDWTDWHHIIGVYDKREMKIYVDGIMKNSTTFTASIRNYSDTFFIGSIGNYAFDGKLDEVKVFNYALTEDEIKQEYNQSKTVSMGTPSEKQDVVMGQASQYCVPGDSATCDPPVAEWKFDEMSGTTANDTSGNGNHGTLTNGPVWTANGKIGGALTLDRVDDRMTVSHNTILEPASLTMEAWVKLNSFGDRHILITKWLGYSLEINSSGFPYLRLNGVSPTDLVSSKAINWGEWHHISATFDNNSKLREIYIDGKKEGSRVESGSISYNQSLLAIPYSSPSWSSGIIDNVKIYNYARTPAQIAWDYNRGAPVGWWRMDEGEGATVYDHSGNENHGTMTNMDPATDWVDGKINKALDFDGGDDRIIIPASTTFDVQNLSISAWVYSSNFTQSGFIFEKGLVNTQYSFFFAGGSVCFRTYNSSGSGDSLYKTLAELGISNGNWYHIVATYNGSFKKIYVNGVEKGSAVYAQVLRTGLGTNQAIGSFGGGNGYFYNGQIDDVRVFNYALTAEQIKQVYNNGAVNFR